MKKSVLTLCAFLLAMLYVSTSFATDFSNPCEKSDSYFKINYASAVRNVDNTVTLSFEVRNYSNKSLSYAAFELPDGSSVISPALKYTKTYSYTIHNGTNYPFEAIKFISDNAASSFKNGQADVFVYTLSALDFDKLTTIRVKAVAGSYVAKVVFVAKACNYTVVIPPAPVCKATSEEAALFPTPLAKDIKYAVDGVPVNTISSVKPGKKLQVCFKIPASATSYTYSLVSYKAPSAVYSIQTAAQQELYDSDMIETKGDSVVCLEVDVPNCYFQVDFVKGCLIKQLGPASSTNFYGVQKRLISNRNGGSVSCIDVTPPPVPVVCDKTDQCFDFSYKGYVVNQDGKTVTLTFKVKTNCDKDLSNVAFELPSGALASCGIYGLYKSAYMYKADITNLPFRAIKFEGIGIKGYKNGVTDEFKYLMNKADFDKMTTIRVQAKAATIVGTVTFDAKGCNTEEPVTCVKPEIELVGPATVSISDNVPVTYTINAKKGNDLTYTWSVPSDWTILSDKNASSISVKVGRKKGTVSASARNSCGVVIKSILVEPVKCVEVDEDHNKDCGKGRDKNHDRYCDKVHGSFCDKTKEMGHNKYCKRDHDTDWNKDNNPTQEESWGITPNPITKGYCEIKLDGKASGQILITDYFTGRPVCTKDFAFGTRSLLLNTQSLGMKKGLYIVVCKKGNETSYSRLIVQQ